VSSSDLDRFVEHRQREGASNGSINRELAALKRMFRLGLMRKKMGAVPAFPHLAENNVRTGFADDDHCQKLLESCPELWFRTLVECGRTYGWRISELLNLRVGQVDLAARTVRLEPGTTKNREGRTVTMTQAVFVLLTACVHGKRPDDFVFTRSDGRAVRDFRVAWHKGCCAAGVGWMICRTCGDVIVSRESPKWQPCPQCKGTIDDLAYRGLIFHDLRRTAARDLRRAGVAEGVIMKIGGWRTRSVFERYSIVSTSDITDGVKKLEASRESYSSGTVAHSAVHSAPSPAGQQIVN
jgi:integrase